MQTPFSILICEYYSVLLFRSLQYINEGYLILLIRDMIFERCNRRFGRETKAYSNEFVANVLCDNIGLVIFDIRGYEGC